MGLILDIKLQKNKQVIEKFVNTAAKNGLWSKRGEFKDNTFIEYLKPIDQNDTFYLEALAKELKERGLMAFVLDKKRADLYVLVKMSLLLPQQQKRIIQNKPPIARGIKRFITNLLVTDDHNAMPFFFAFLVVKNIPNPIARTNTVKAFNTRKNINE